MEELDRLRTQINEIDCKLVELYTQRMEVCRAVGQYKKAHDLPVLDAAREKQVLQSKAALVQQPALRPYVTALFEQIMAQSRTLQTKLGTAWPPDKERAYAAYRRAVDHPAALPDRQRVIYQGQPGAYAEQAAVAYFGAACTRTNAKSWEGVLVAIREGLGEYGVLPIENSSTGSINAVYDLLAQYGCAIVGEQIIRVEHALMAPKGASLETICQVYSHEQGLLQCRPFLARHPHWIQQAEPNTALAAKLVAESGDVTKAAIASPRTAELYGLQVLEEKVNFNDANYTRFVIVADAPQITQACDKVSVVFTVPHTEGSLHRVLAIFATNGRNLLKLESRPIVGKSWEYTFFADFSGNLRSEGMDDTIRQLIDETISFRILGNYRAAHI